MATLFEQIFGNGRDGVGGLLGNPAFMVGSGLLSNQGNPWGGALQGLAAAQGYKLSEAKMKKEAEQEQRLSEAQAMQMKAMQDAQKRQETTQGLLTTLNIPQVREAYSTPEMQAVLRPYVVANADPAALEQAGLLAPLPSSQEEPSIVRTIRAMGGDPQDPKWQAVIMQSLVKPQTSINMGAQFPDLPKDHMWVNPLNPAEGVKPIPNSPTDLSQRAAAEKEGTGTGNTIARIDNVMSELDRAISGVGYTTTGLIGAATKNLPGSPAKDLSGSLTTIKANIGFNELQAMREASPTGGALGQVAVQELEALQSVLASLEQEQSPERVAENLNKVKNHYARWRSIVEQAKQNGQGAPIVPNSSPSQNGGRVVDFNSLP